MKLLLDQHLSFKLAKQLANDFPGTSQVRLLNLQEADDAVIWEYAKKHGFAIATKDSDFFERSSLMGHPPKVLWLRCGNQPTSYIEQLIRSHAQRIQDFGDDPTAGCLEIY